MTDATTDTTRSLTMPVGVVVHRRPGVTRWQRWSYVATDLLPGAAMANWLELRRDGDVTEFHAGTLPLTIWRTDAEAYRIALSEKIVSAYVVMTPPSGDDLPGLKLITANPHEAMQYAEGADDLVEKVPMPPALIAWLQDWTDLHYAQEPFKKRKRKRYLEDLVEDGKGDARIRQVSDVYRAPSRNRSGGAS